MDSEYRGWAIKIETSGNFYVAIICKDGNEYDINDCDGQPFMSSSDATHEAQNQIDEIMRRMN